MRSINWKVRVCNKNFWIILIPAVALAVQATAAVFGYELNLGDLANKLILVVNTVFAVLVIIGIVSDPTTKGIKDSEQALSYSKPKEGNKNE